MYKTLWQKGQSHYSFDDIPPVDFRESARRGDIDCVKAVRLPELKHTLYEALVDGHVVGVCFAGNTVWETN